MIKPVIVVEGKKDVEAVKRAVDAECIITGGFSLNPVTLARLEKAYERCGLIILTDPDSAGERIRKFLMQRFPNAKQAFVPRSAASSEGRIGVEKATADAIRAALESVRGEEKVVRIEFVWQDIWTAGLTGGTNAATRRGRLGDLLGIGHVNAKSFLRRLNNFGVTREEFEQALARLENENE